MTVAPVAVAALSGVVALSVTVAQYMVVDEGETLNVVEAPAMPAFGEPTFVGPEQLAKELVWSWTL